MQKLNFLSWGILFGSFFFTLLIWVGFSYSLTQIENQEFLAKSDLLTHTITDELKQYEQVLIGSQGLFAMSSDIDFNEWNSFITSHHIDARFPGLQGVGYIEYVLHEERDELVSKMRTSGFNDFDIKPTGNRDEYYPVLFVEPLDIRNEKAIGYDVYFENTRKTAVDLVKDTGETTITGKITLVQEIDDDVQNGFLMLSPIFSNEDPLKLKGIVYTVFRINDFVQGTIDSSSFEYIQLKIYDDNVSNEGLFFDSTDIYKQEFDSHDFSHTTSSSINNRNWVFVYNGMEEPLNQIDTVILYFIPIVGFSMSIVLFYLFRVLAKNLKLSQSARKIEKITAMGTMASRLSHDLRNPLTVIKSNLQLMKINFDKSVDDKTVLHFIRIEDAVESISRIINDVLEFSRTSTLKKEKITINEILTYVLSDIQVPENIKIILPEKEYSLFVDKSKMSAVISNIITNAIQSIYGDGKISITINENSENLAIIIEDSGRGIPKGKLLEIFEPLFTTKVTGTGLGLSICKNIVERHGGTISASNNPTRFTILLPKKT